MNVLYWAFGLRVTLIYFKGGWTEKMDEENKKKLCKTKKRRRRRIILKVKPSEIVERIALGCCKKLVIRMGSIKIFIVVYKKKKKYDAASHETYIHIYFHRVSSFFIDYYAIISPCSWSIFSPQHSFSSRTFIHKNFSRPMSFSSSILHSIFHCCRFLTLF